MIRKSQLEEIVQPILQNLTIFQEYLQNIITVLLSTLDKWIFIGCPRKANPWSHLFLQKYYIILLSALFVFWKGLISNEKSVFFENLNKVYSIWTVSGGRHENLSQTQIFYRGVNVWLWVWLSYELYFVKLTL